MKKVYPFGVSQLRIGALIAFLEALLSLLTNNPFFDGYGDFFKKKLAAAVKHLVDVHSRHRANMLTPEVKAADRYRDAVLTNLFAFINMMAAGTDEAKRKAAETLKRVKKDFGQISNMPYNVQTGTIVSFLNDMRNFHTAEIETLGISEMLDEVERANNSFVEIFAERNAADAPVQKGDLQKAKKAAIAAYRDIESCLNIYCKEYIKFGDTKEGIETLPELIDLVNSEIEHQKISLALSKKRKGEEAEEEEIEEDIDSEEEGFEEEKFEEETEENF